MKDIVTEYSTFRTRAITRHNRIEQQIKKFTELIDELKDIDNKIMDGVKKDRANEEDIQRWMVLFNQYNETLEKISQV